MERFAVSAIILIKLRTRHVGEIHSEYLIKTRTLPVGEIHSEYLIPRTRHVGEIHWKDSLAVSATITIILKISLYM